MQKVLLIVRLVAALRSLGFIIFVPLESCCGFFRDRSLHAASAFSVYSNLATLIRQIRSIWTFPLSLRPIGNGFLQLPQVCENLGYWVLQYILSFKMRPIGRIDLTCWTVVRNPRVLKVQARAESEEHGLHDQHLDFQSRFTKRVIP